MAAETRFRAMGSDVHVNVVGGPASLVTAVPGFLESLEQKWSRFRPTSEVSLVNLMAGYPVRVSWETAALVELALEGARLTEGRYDPTVLGDVIRAGYDRSFELLDETTGPADSALRTGHEGITVDPAGSTVMVPPGVGFDPGGIGKGYAADLLVRELLDRGAAGACANVGGDLRVEGEPPAGASWVVGIEHPFLDEPAVTIGLRGGAAATTTRTRRAWGSNGDRRHHLIDPVTGRAPESGLASATVIAAEGWLAEVLAKAAFVAGLPRGLRVLAETQTDGLLIDDRGSVHESMGLVRFTGVERPVLGGSLP